MHPFFPEGRPLPPPERIRWFWRLAIVLAGLMFFAARLRIGVDITDESYYVTHIVEWLHNGFRTGKSLNINQLSELIVYPVARLSATGTFDGVVLRLRWVYAGMAIAAALSLFAFLIRLRPAPVAALGAALGVAFIPFSLPAPSYNTIALFAMVGALSLFGSAVLDLDRGPLPSGPRLRPLLPALAGSAVLWVITAVVYPTLALGPGLLFLAAWLAARSPDERRLVALYILLCAAAAALGGLGLLAIFGPERLLATYEFTSGSAGLVDTFGAKIGRTVDLYLSRPHVALPVLALVAAIVTSLAIRPRQARLWLGLAFCALLVPTVIWPPVAYLRSHDVLNLAWLLALYILATTNRATPEGRIVLVLVAVSFLAGLVTGSTAGGGVNNIAIGGFFAAAASLVMLVPSGWEAGSSSWETVPWARAALLLPLALTVAVAGYASQTWIYGEVTGQRPEVPTRMRSGPYRGLVTAPAMAQYVDAVDRAFAAHRRPGATLTVFGAVSGLYLIADYAPQTLSTWPLRSYTGPPARRATEEFLNANPPDFIAFYSDDWGEGLGQYEIGLLERYRPVVKLDAEWRHFELHERVR